MSHDLSKLYIKFHEAIPGKKLTEQFSELSAFPEFNNVLDDNEIKIAILMGDIDSPFIRIRNRETMLNSIFDYLDIPTKIKSDQEFFKKVLHYKHSGITGCWVRYIQILHDTDWTDWTMAQQTYNFLLFESQSPEEKDEGPDKYLARRLKIQESIKKIGIDIKLIESKLFPDSKSAREASLYENKRIFTYAEKYAKENTYI
jgi:hypothetical protein